MYNTPPTYAWYLAGLVFKWLKDMGGLDTMAVINERKAELLYQAIDTSTFYANPVDPEARSWMNVPFTLADAALDDTFLADAKAEGLAYPQGPPLRRRDARQHLQRHARDWGLGLGGLHAGV